MPAPLSPRAIRRLMHDLEEIETNPIATVAARPAPHDLSSWHVNLRPADGPFAGSVFHFRLQFPSDYPRNPPNVEMLSTGMPGHPNVFGRAGSVYICLSMLKPHTASVKYDGWTSAYSCMSLLLQLQSFLFADTIEQDYGETEWHKERAYDQSHFTPSRVAQVRANNCHFRIQIDEATQHTHDAPWPPFVDQETLSYAPVPASILHRREAVAARLELEQRLIEMDALSSSMAHLEVRAASSRESLTYRDVAVLREGRTALTNVSTSRAAIEARLAGALEAEREAHEHEVAWRRGDFVELPADLLVTISDHMRVEDLLSFGRVCRAWRDVHRTHNLFVRRQLCCFYTKERFATSRHLTLGVGLRLELHPSGSLKEISTPFDLISEAAFKQDGARLSVWKEAFTHFLPLAINAAHFERALPLLQRVTKQAFGEHAKTTHLFELLAAAMNSMVVHLFDAHGATTTAPPLHASDVAIEGYCAFHHLLLCSAERWPDIRAEAEGRMNAFVESDRGRDKCATPDLGRLLICLTLSSKGWHALRSPFLKEMLARNVRWALQKKRWLGTTSPPHAPSPRVRASATFEASLTSLRLVAFQIAFMHQVGRPAGSTGPSDVLAGYMRRLGRPTQVQRERLQATAKLTLQLGGWSEFFLLVGAQVPDSMMLHELLVGAVASSARKGYHRT